MPAGWAFLWYLASLSASAEEAAQAADAIGYPVMLKAAAGGGGRGMRVVHAADEVADAFARCRSEAASAFGDDAMFVEKLVQRPRHIEVQILADAGGNVVHLRERDCSYPTTQSKGGGDRAGAQPRAGAA